MPIMHGHMSIDAIGKLALRLTSILSLTLNSGRFPALHHVPFCVENVIRARPILPSMPCRGYTPMAEQTLDPDHQSQGDTKEGADNQFIYPQYANPTIQLACIAWALFTCC